MKEKELIAIVLTFDKKFNKELINLWKVIDKKFNINYIGSHSSKPHITLLSGHILDISKLKKVLEKKKYFSFSLTSPGIAIFAKKLNPLIYIRWKLSNDLLNIYKEIYKSTARIFSDLSENTEFSLWVPKTTIAYKDFGYKKLNLILKEIYKINFKKKIDIKKLEVMKISSRGEKIIYSYNLL